MEEVERREEDIERVLLPVLVPAPEVERVVTVEGARDTLEEERREVPDTTEERVLAPLRADAPLRTPADLVARETLLREAEELRAKLLWEAAPRALKFPSR